MQNMIRELAVACQDENDDNIEAKVEQIRKKYKGVVEEKPYLKEILSVENPYNDDMMEE